MIDVHIRHVIYKNEPAHLREALGLATLAAWELDPLVKIHISHGFGVDFENLYNWSFRRYAEVQSQSDLYVVSDDDILPLGKDWIARAIAVAERNPDYAMLVANQVNYSARIKPQGYEVQPREMSGSPMMIRRGMVDWPALSGIGKDEDAIIGKYCKEHELKIGTMVDLEVNHIGQGFSVMNPEMWMRP